MTQPAARGYRISAQACKMVHDTHSTQHKQRDTHFAYKSACRAKMLLMGPSRRMKDARSIAKQRLSVTAVTVAARGCVVCVHTTKWEWVGHFGVPPKEQRQ